MDWEYHAQDVVTGEWLARDLELAEVELELVVSGTGGLTFSVGPHDPLLVAPDGGPVFREWRTAVYAVLQGEVYAAGIVQRVEFDETAQRVAIEAPGFLSWWHGQPFGGEFVRWNVDPFDAVRAIHSDLYAAGGLKPKNWTVTSAKSAARVGDVKPPARPDEKDWNKAGHWVRVAGVWPIEPPEDSKPFQEKPPFKKPGKVPQKGKKPTKGAKPPKGNQPKRKKNESDAAYKARVKAWNQAYDAKVAAWDGAYNVRVAAWEADYEQRRDAYDFQAYVWKGFNVLLKAAQEAWDDEHSDKKPYELVWWESPDCGQELDRLAGEVPFDYRMVHTLSADSETVSHRLDLHYPRYGRRLSGLRFVEGENIAIVPKLVRDGGEYANSVVALGAGEGRKMVRAWQTVSDGRLYRRQVLPLKDVSNKGRLGALAAESLRAANVLGEFDEITIFDHVNAPFGEWQVGDEILVDIESGTIRERVWHRIVSAVLKPVESDMMVLRLVRAEKAA